MRVISNRSSGELGQRLAKGLKKRGAKVTLIEGPVNKPLQSKVIRVIKFKFYDDLIKIARSEAKKNYDIIIHAAAVSDYKLKNTCKSKLRSGIKDLKLHLVPTIKIINLFKRINPRAVLVGFKLEPGITTDSVRKKVKRLFEEASCDIVIANSLKNDKYKGFLADKKGIISHANNRKEITDQLINTLVLKT